MSRLEALRNKLHLIWEEGNPDEILRVSQELDVEIVKHMKRFEVSKRNSLRDKNKIYQQQFGLKGLCEHGYC
ncbi:hypothetical protein DP73_18215 [Desulfosporosinus sp. HMP52]|uniref:Spo0E family sporulation regulatory protein-aspartic acid phosphatase n=1 Tax=Desulfosporosinus sp. HMP52 TaxID=1487923 RepID=UPI00051FD7AB|nr:Spo0E family sporulation regulatory protein-aspartic acid phosphatase [Desulfosporosinus sp. HMP52]KGK85756.1 hypothetical protein DP73_18215 [Desulfosporosinus sp. HMP52]